MNGNNGSLIKDKSIDMVNKTLKYPTLINQFLPGWQKIKHKFN